MNPESFLSNFRGFIMSTKKRKQKSLHDLLSYMQMLEDGISFSHIHKNYGINEVRLKICHAIRKKAYQDCKNSLISMPITH